MFRFSFLLTIFLIFNPVKGAQTPDVRNKPYEPLHATRLVTDVEHKNFLKETLATATTEVMISTRHVSPAVLFDEGLGAAIVDAARRGVKVYIYFKDRPRYSDEEYQDLLDTTSYCAKFEQNDNHSKCVLKDKNMAAIGSYNWLSEARAGSSDGTLVLTGQLAPGLISDVWQGMRFYQSLEYGNERGVEKFLQDSDAFSTGEYQFAPGEYFYTLRTPDAHGLLLTDVLKKAKKRILLFSPFIRLDKLKNTFSAQALENLKLKSVDIKIVTLANPCNLFPAERSGVFSYLKELNTSYSNFTYDVYHNFHAKTLIADDDFMCEGSFNWLSAVTQIDHGANRFEMSVAIRGKIAASHVYAFENTTIGKHVLSKPAVTSSLSGNAPSVEVKTRQQEPGGGQTSKRSRTLENKPIFSVKQQKTTPRNIPSPFDNLVEVFSGEKYGKQGYCVRFNDGDYVRDDNDNIAYFPSQTVAKQAAFDNLVEVFSGEKYGVCVHGNLEKVCARKD